MLLLLLWSIVSSLFVQLFWALWQFFSRSSLCTRPCWCSCGLFSVSLLALERLERCSYCCRGSWRICADHVVADVASFHERNHIFYDLPETPPIMAKIFFTKLHVCPAFTCCRYYIRKWYWSILYVRLQRFSLQIWVISFTFFRA